MNREIKFRAWDKECNLMREVLRYTPRTGHVLLSLTNGKDYEPSKVVLMQYTGLKDKNGKEIYEGDILGNDEGAERTKVEWNEQSGEWTLNGLENLAKWVSLLKIIGNIYENPELIK